MRLLTPSSQLCLLPIPGNGFHATHPAAKPKPDATGFPAFPHRRFITFVPQAARSPPHKARMAFLSLSHPPARFLPTLRGLPAPAPCQPTNLLSVPLGTSHPLEPSYRLLIGCRILPLDGNPHEGPGLRPLPSLMQDPRGAGAPRAGRGIGPARPGGSPVPRSATSPPL